MKLIDQAQPDTPELISEGMSDFQNIASIFTPSCTAEQRHGEKGPTLRDVLFAVQEYGSSITLLKMQIGHN